MYRNFDILGDAIVAFVGPYQVVLGKMVDIEEVKTKAPIDSPLMLHFIAEFFHNDLELAVCRQRLLIIVANELLEELTTDPVRQKGADLYTHRPDVGVGKHRENVERLLYWLRKDGAYPAKEDETEEPSQPIKERRARVLKMSGHLSQKEIARRLGVSLRTVQRDYKALNLSRKST